MGEPDWKGMKLGMGNVRSEDTKFQLDKKNKFRKSFVHYRHELPTTAKMVGFKYSFNPNYR